MATTAQFIAAPVIDITQIGPTANSGRTGLGTVGNDIFLICSGPTFPQGSGIGKRITRGTIHGVSGNSAGVVRFFYSPDTGVTKRLILEKITNPTTVTSTTSSFRSEIPELIGFVLPGVSGSNVCQIYAATHISDTYNIMIESGTL
jgi:hypothetical protein